MKKNLLITGLVLIFVGLLVASLAVYANVDVEAIYVEDSNKWTIAWDLAEGEELGVSFRPHSDWAIQPTPMGFGEAYVLPPENGTLFPYVKLFEVNVTNPAGNFTLVDIYLIVDTPNTGSISAFPDYFTVALNTGGLQVDESYPKPELIKEENVIKLGKVAVGGHYDVMCRLDPPKLWDEQWTGVDNQTTHVLRDPSPPPLLRLYKITTEIGYPYRIPFFVPISAVVVVTGAIVALFGTRGEKHVRHKSIVKSMPTDSLFETECPKRLHSAFIRCFAHGPCKGFRRP